MHNVCASIFVGLEQNSDDFTEVHLELLFVLVFFLEEKSVLFVKLVIFVFSLLVFLIFNVALNSVLGLLDEFENLVSKLINACWLQQVLACFFKNILESFSLSNKTLSLGFRVHGLNNVVRVLFGKLMDQMNVLRLSFLCALKK